jgi:GntR family transcriptional repressor for pyruvate dehydrogenase complex
LLYGDQKLTVAGETVEWIAGMIRDGSYSPGDRLPGERQLAKLLKVSRASVREALGKLETVGLVECRHGLGTFVKDPSREILQAALMPYILTDQETVRKLFQIRQLIEVEAAGLAAQCAGSGQIAEMARWVEAVESHISRGNTNGIVMADAELHRQIIIATGNDILVDLLDSIADLLRAMRRDSINIPGLLPQIVSDHRAIFEAIEAKDSQAARQAMQGHLAGIIAQVKETWSDL